MKIYALYILLNIHGTLQAHTGALPAGFTPETKYICGDAFLHACDHFVTTSTNLQVAGTIVSFEPHQVKNGDTIFVNNPYLSYFFTHLHPKIQARYILVAHGGDDPIPGRHKQYLDDPKIIAWFGQNCDITEHPKFHRIPIGLANGVWPWGSKQVLEEVMQLVAQGKIKKTKLLYMNFTIATNVPERAMAYKAFAKKPFCTRASQKAFGNYLRELAQHKFVVSPHGNGLDCHRTWEAILVGCIPIVKHSTLDALYTDLPVLIVKDWQEVTQELLERVYPQLMNMQYNQEKLFLNYWLNLIRAYQTH